MYVLLSKSGESLGDFGASVTGVHPREVFCKNWTTGQLLQFDPSSAPSWNCLAAGLLVSRGDNVTTRVKGLLDDSAEVVAGTVTGTRPVKAGCTNLTTEQHVGIALEGETAWNCTDLGHEVAPGDLIQMSVRGKAD